MIPYLGQTDIVCTSLQGVSHNTPSQEKRWTLLTSTCTLIQAYISMLPHCRITLTRNCRKMNSNLHKIYFDFFIPAWMRSACSIGLIYSVLKRNFYERVHSTLKRRVNNYWVFLKKISYMTEESKKLDHRASCFLSFYSSPNSHCLVIGLVNIYCSYSMSGTLQRSKDKWNFSLKVLKFFMEN